MTDSSHTKWPQTTIKASSYLKGRIGWQGLKASEFTDHGPYLITGTDFRDGRIEWSTCYHVTEARFQEGFYIHIRDGDLLITKDGTIGKVAYVTACPTKAVLNSGIFLLRCSDGSYEHRFLYHLLQSHFFDTFLRLHLAGSTINHLYQNVFERFAFPIPDIRVQRRFADILDSIDGQIRQTEELLAKYHQIKAGLMRDLFTRGVTQDGRLRPLKESLDTQFGRIPKDWEIGSLLDVADPSRQPILTGPFGADLGNDDFVTEGVPLLRIGNVQQSRLDLSDLLFVSEAKARELQRYKVNDGDLLFARQGATTGRNALATQEAQGFLINYHIIRVALDHSQCAPLFVEAAFASDIVKRQIERDKGRGTREGINTAQLKALQVPFASLNEQRTIAQILKADTSQLQETQKQLTKLQSLKKGLMHDLLSGRVRVNVK